MPSSQDFSIFCDRYLPTVLLHHVIGLTAIQYYVIREDCAPNGLLRTISTFASCLLWTGIKSDPLIGGPPSRCVRLYSSRHSSR
ncbi:uncharacterized protein P174DRAFT_442690 [Aspergillus novofumigatus IBT 16806]|uniref:Uncharacterized protein n=1 Tax=Aspergillus novofumigatus (strain IBT 16806) TaxID=1392255 RepID=A0A2I1C5C1_ASPN1|nr:uncharacterized protein P174DRAFT_442690 [Aspergillus novofumigatus IBT 16806]PKX92804.1 hypothetical protein P174DRAFT_442690 [Aspergillus novofumigatus IBT 16806]